MRTLILILFCSLLVNTNFADARQALQTFDQSSSFCGSAPDFRHASNELIEAYAFNIRLEQNRTSVQTTQCETLGKEAYQVCTSCSNNLSEEAMTFLRPILASQNHLFWHQQWHSARDANLFGRTLTQKIFTTFVSTRVIPDVFTKEKFEDFYDAKAGRYAGENFFYMHRMMIKMVQLDLSLAKFPCLNHTTNISLDDPHWSPPALSVKSNLKKRITKEFERIQAIIKEYLDTNFLRSIDLNTLGVRIDNGLHGRLHLFYKDPRGSSPEAKAQGFKDELFPVGHSSVNRFFWKIHGLVDELLVAWLDANGYQEISIDCDGRPKCYPWQGTWVGAYPYSN